MILMTGEELSKNINLELKQQVKGYMIKPCLAVIQVGENRISKLHAEKKLKISDEIGVYLKYICFPEDTKEIEIVNKIVELNNDDYVNGIVLELPLPDKYNQEKLINYIARNKDVAGLTDLNLGKIFNNKKCYVPHVAQAVVALCQQNKIDLIGKHAVIVNRSSLIGKPLAGLLLNNDATVTICHLQTNNLKEIINSADILISAIGVPNIISGSSIKNDTVVFDLGVSFSDDKFSSDINPKELSDNVFYIDLLNSYFEEVSIAFLLKNTIESYQKMNEEK